MDSASDTDIKTSHGTRMIKNIQVNQAKRVNFKFGFLNNNEHSLLLYKLLVHFKLVKELE